MPIEIEIHNGAGGTTGYLGWSPMPARLVAAPPIAFPPAPAGTKVKITSRRVVPNGGLLRFSLSPAGPFTTSVHVNVPTAAAPTPFYVAGRFGRPSVQDQDCEIYATGPAPFAGMVTRRRVMVRVRKNANLLTAVERDRFVNALATLNNQGLGRFRDFRNMHVDASSPEAHGNVGFLPWHRAYLLDLERELQAIDPSVALPYWRFDQPAPNLFSPDFVGRSNAAGNVEFAPSNPLGLWATDGVPGVVRTPAFDTATRSAFVINETDTLNLGSDYLSFSGMEGDPHGSAHTSFGGYISRIPTAARDPLFFLLHANVDRLWAKWQWANSRFATAGPAASSTYPRLGSAGAPGSTRIGHNLLDSMWPWNGVTAAPRPPVAPGGTFPLSASTAAPGLSPTVGQMIDYKGLTASANRLGMDYDDTPYL